jgi:lipoprotein-anchoring transpeptidase ErfK/SrfK
MAPRQAGRFAAVAACALLAAACDDFKPARHAQATRPNQARGQTIAQASAVPLPVPTAAPAPGANAVTLDQAGPTPPMVLPPQGPANPAATPIEAATAPPQGPPSRDLIVKVETLLDRADFSPGVIDGGAGANLGRAVAAYEAAHGLSDTGGAPDQALLDALVKADPGPILQTYVTTKDDVQGPFLGALPHGFLALSKLSHVGYLTPLQELAERFHMSQVLLKRLNPDADFSVAGTSILVVRPGEGRLAGQVARVEVDKTNEQVRALDGAGKVLAAFPATVGSAERPAPAGEWKVSTVVRDPTYTYDPARLTFGDKRHGRLTIAPGPNNPVGDVWIGLTAPTYGIHGTPDPALVGKTASHGCVRLTNWDAAELAGSVKKGTPVVFVGAAKA